MWHVVVWPALVAGLVAIGATVAVERLGGRRGGLLGSMPSTIVPASLGMYAGASEPGVFVAAMAAVPAGMLVDAAFLWSWRVLPARLPARGLHARLAAMSLISLGVWAGGAITLVLLMRALVSAGVSALVPGAMSFFLLVAVGIAACSRAPPSPKGTNPVTLPMLAARGALAGTAIAVSIGVASTGAPMVGGMASVFPAIFLTTMVSLWLAQGEAVPIGAVGPIILGSSSVSAYALLAAWLIPAWGPGPGSVLSWCLAVLATTLPAATFLRGMKPKGNLGTLPRA